MINISEKYKNEIKAMKADAEANLNEAAQTEADRTHVMQQSREKVEKLQITATSSHKEFWKALRQLFKLIFTKAPTPEAVALVTQPCNTYMTAAKALPQAETELYDAKSDLCKAQEVLLDAEDTLQTINFLVSD